MCAYILKADIAGTDSARKPASSAASRARPLGGTSKRIFDVVGASLALVLFAPLMLMAALLVRAVLGGPVLRAQRRVGFDGRMFACYEFRTADRFDDAGVTCLGNVLRKSGIHRLPQLFNVLRGEMSLVGPRPVSPEGLPRYGSHARAYLRARPGMTGMRCGGGRRDEGRVARDCYYARHWSLWLDAGVLIKTIPALVDFERVA
jgi:exopolysaccharide production protein ExoY